MHLQTRNVLGVLQCCNCFLVAVYIGHTLSINAHILRAERERERCKLKVSLSLSSSCLSPADTVTSAAAALRTKTHSNTYALLHNAGCINRSLWYLVLFHLKHTHSFSALPSTNMGHICLRRRRKIPLRSHIYVLIVWLRSI